MLILEINKYIIIINYIGLPMAIDITSSVRTNSKIKVSSHVPL